MGQKLAKCRAELATAKTDLGRVVVCQTTGNRCGAE